MKLASRLRLSRCGIYQFRLVLPANIAVLLGQKSIIHSLNTKRPEQARLAAYAISAKIVPLLRKMRRAKRMSAYITQLRREAEEPAIQSHGHTKRPGLEARFRAWFDSLPLEVRRRPFSMNEFEIALHSHGRYISAVLVQLGWRRKRVWSAQRYCRYWVPPNLGF